jgi:RNA polymerase sigma-70 factor, ECF subfamily
LGVRGPSPRTLAPAGGPASLSRHLLHISTGGVHISTGGPGRRIASRRDGSGALAGQDAEDIASETWLQVTRDLPAFTGTYDGFRGWVATIARHRALDHLRKTARRPPALALPAEDLAARPAAADTAQAAMDAIDAVATAGAVALIATLPPDQAEAVLLRAVLGLDAATAGHVLGKRPGAVRTAAHRGLKTLHKRLDDDLDVTGDRRTRGIPSR